MILPSDVSVGSHSNLMINAEKLGYLWVTDRDNLSGYNPTGDLMVQKAYTQVTYDGGNSYWGGYWSSPAYYEWGTNPTTKEIFYTITLPPNLKPGPLNQYNLDSTHPIPVDVTGKNGVPTYSTTTLFCPQVPTPSISAKPDNTQGILWAVENSNSLNTGSNPTCNGTSTGAVLHAYDATKVNNAELYNSGTKLSANTPTKFLPPTVFKGRVYIGTYQTSTPTNGELDTFGICTSGPTGSCL